VGALKSSKEDKYAFERGLGKPRSEAARAIGLNPRTGAATKLEAKPRVRRRIEEYQKLGFTDEKHEAIRQGLNLRLHLISNGTRKDFDPADLERGLPDWNAVLNALNQLRDMHGFKGPTKLEHTGANGDPVRMILEEIDGKTRGLPSYAEASEGEPSAANALKGQPSEAPLGAKEG
jgi:hypothetical protein